MGDWWKGGKPHLVKSSTLSLKIPRTWTSIKDFAGAESYTWLSAWFRCDERVASSAERVCRSGASGYLTKQEGDERINGRGRTVLRLRRLSHTKRQATMRWRGHGLPRNQAEPLAIPTSPAFRSRVSCFKTKSAKGKARAKSRASFVSMSSPSDRKRTRRRAKGTIDKLRGGNQLLQFGHTSFFNSRIVTPDRERTTRPVMDSITTRSILPIDRHTAAALAYLFLSDEVKHGRKGESFFQMILRSEGLKTKPSKRRRARDHVRSSLRPRGSILNGPVTASSGFALFPPRFAVLKLFGLLGIFPVHGVENRIVKVQQA